MRKQQPEPTTAGNLERKFEAGAEVLDYFDLSKTKSVSPQPKSSLSLGTLKRTRSKKALVREQPRGYRTKKKS